MTLPLQMRKTAEASASITIAKEAIHINTDVYFHDKNNGISAED